MKRGHEANVVIVMAVVVVVVFQQARDCLLPFAQLVEDANANFVLKSFVSCAIVGDETVIVESLNHPQP